MSLEWRAPGGCQGLRDAVVELAAGPEFDVPDLLAELSWAGRSAILLGGPIEWLHELQIVILLL